MDCVFCKIVAGEIPSKTLYEDELVKAFYDINPSAPVHFLVIPKKHIASLSDISAENSAVIAHIYEVIARLAGELKLDKGYRVISNCGEDAGQTVFHIHFHVLSGVNMGPMLVYRQEP
jgi:Diadenosine tetraphosphate (Ap4A) hydrolase and other HIT family hydrolases